MIFLFGFWPYRARFGLYNRGLNANQCSILEVFHGEIRSDYSPWMLEAAGTSCSRMWQHTWLYPLGRIKNRYNSNSSSSSTNRSSAQSLLIINEIKIRNNLELLVLTRQHHAVAHLGIHRHLGCRRAVWPSTL